MTEGFFTWRAGQQCAEVSVGRYKNTVLGRGPVEDHNVFCPLPFDRANVERNVDFMRSEVPFGRHLGHVR